MRYNTGFMIPVESDMVNAIIKVEFKEFEDSQRHTEFSHAFAMAIVETYRKTVAEYENKGGN